MPFIDLSFSNFEVTMFSQWSVLANYSILLHSDIIWTPTRNVTLHLEIGAVQISVVMCEQAEALSGRYGFRVGAKDVSVNLA